MRNGERMRLAFQSDGPHAASPGQPSAKSDEQHTIARCGTAGTHGLVQSNRNRSCRSITVAVQIYHELVRRKIQVGEGSVDDALVDLVWDHQVDVGRREVAFGQSLANQCDDGPHSKFEYFAA